MSEEGVFSDLEHKYKSIIDSLMFGVIIIGSDLCVATFNEQMKVWFPHIREGMLCREVLGCGEVCNGLNCLVLKTFTDGQKHEKKFRIEYEEEVKIFRMVVSPMRSKDGTIAAAVKLVEDVTEAIKRETTDIQTSQLAAVGQLAAGIAHEFNNINAVVKGHVELLLQDDSLSEPAREQVRTVLEMVKHGVDITRNMLLFARDKKGKASGAYLSDIVRDVLSIIKNDLRQEGVVVSVDNQPNVRVMVNVSQIGQVFINLIQNARHAMMGKEERRLIIKTWEEEDFAYVSFEDNGCGIAEKHIKKLFSPFFTTKGEHAEAGSPLAAVKGTGLGLSICHTIVEKQHGGKIEVRSEAGKGTKFVVALPLYEGPVDVKKTTVCLNRTVNKANGERVLVIDDEPKILTIVDMVLSNQGYEVITCSDSVEALKIYKEKPCFAVISDIKMPKVNGWGIVEYMQKMNPRPITVLMTGAASEDDNIDNTKADAVLHKPFAFEDLLGVLGMGLQAYRFQLKRGEQYV